MTRGRAPREVQQHPGLLPSPDGTRWVSFGLEDQHSVPRAPHDTPLGPPAHCRLSKQSKRTRSRQQAACPDTPGGYF